MTAVSNNACIMFQLELMLATFLHSSAEPRPWGRADLKGLEFGRDDWWSSVKRGSGHVAISPMFDHPMSRWNMPIQLNLRESDLQWKKSSVFFWNSTEEPKGYRAGSFKSNVIEVKSWLILLDTYSYYVNVHHCNYIVHYFNIIWIHVDSNYHW